MKIFEVLNTPPGVSYTVNDPDITGTVDSNGNNTSNIKSTPGMGNSNVANVSSTSQSVGMNSNPITNGSTMNLPVGPNKTKTPMKVTNVSQPQGQNRKRMVTIVDPQKPNDSGQTYDYDELQKAAANNRG